MREVLDRIWKPTEIEIKEGNKVLKKIKAGEFRSLRCLITWMFKGSNKNLPKTVEAVDPLLGSLGVE